jgi:hypothetical protein
MYRKNTSGQFLCFQGVDATTGGIKSGVTWTARRCIDGTFAAAGATVTEDGTAGWYKAALTQADTNGNDISFNFTGTGAIPQTVNIITTALDPTSTAFGLSIAKTTNITGFNDITAAAAATGVWQDTTAGDFTVASSIGKSLYTTGNAPGAASGLALVGSNVGTATSVSGSVGSVTGAVGSVTAAVTVGTNNDKTGYSTTDWTTQLTESYRANGAAPTPAQAVHEILGHLGEQAISGTTKTVKKLDHSTTAETFTLDNAVTPSSITRAT